MVRSFPLINGNFWPPLGGGGYNSLFGRLGWVRVYKSLLVALGEGGGGAMQTIVLKNNASISIL